MYRDGFGGFTVNETDHLLNAREVAQMLRLQPRSVRRLSHERRLPPALKIGRCLRWRRSDIVAFMSEPRVDQVE
jgi:predicted DNA-binding transcriptional regulator AlpA